MKKTIKLLSIIAVVTLSITSCKKDNTIEPNENEVITTVEVHLTEQATGNHLIYKWEDLDGDGGNAPVIDDIVLAAGKVYDAEITLLDKTKSPADDITEEVAEEANNHRFYYEPNATTNIVVSHLNNDDNGMPLGITSVWTTGTATTGQIQITLRHYESGGKAADDPINSTKSSTDATVLFTTTVQ